jgi:hypothetical protein
MENPFSHNRATNIIGRVLDKLADESEYEKTCDHTDEHCKISFASLEYRIMMALWEADCLADSALETVGLAGRQGYAELHEDHGKSA